MFRTMNGANVAVGPSTRPAGRPPKDVPQGDATRRRIREVATELFAEAGYHSTGTAEIGRRAGVRQGALYYHIGSKEELLYEVLKAHVEETLRGERAIAALDLPADGKLERLITHQVATIARRRDEVAIYLRERQHLTGQRATDLQELRDEVEQIWRRVVAEGVASGAFRAVDHIEINGLLGMVNMVFYWYRPDGELGPEDIARRFVDLALRGIRHD
jgi:AcrR family transcriptional regulator